MAFESTRNELSAKLESNQIAAGSERMVAPVAAQQFFSSQPNKVVVCFATTKSLFTFVWFGSVN